MSTLQRKRKKMSATDLHAFATQKLSEARITLDLQDYDRKILGKCGPAIFVCNRLLPGLDEWVLLQLLSEQFPFVKILHPYPAPTPKALKSNVLRTQSSHLPDRFFRIRFAKKASRRVEHGMALGLSLDFSEDVFDQFGKALIGKNLLRPQVLKQLRKAGQPIVPIHLSADRLPGGLFRKLLGAIPFLPSMGLSAPVRISVRIGQPIQPTELRLFERNRDWGRFLQAKIFSLGSPFDIRPEQFASTTGLDAFQTSSEPLADPVSPDLLAADLASLSPAQKITSRGQFDVFVAPFHDLPHVMFEVGRLREQTFRAAGEGTGKPRDMDEYDLYYLQLIIWDRDAQKVVGGYRLGQGDLIFKRFGINGFYTHSLFKMKPAFFPILQQAVELGRSYVSPEYQKHRLPLFLLWKGILHFLLAHPQYRYLYGPVSISKEFSDVSKGVIVEFVQRYCYDEALAKLVRPRKPFRYKAKSVDTALLAEALQGEFDALEAFIEAIEPEHFKVPVLFRQYLKQNARFISFNVDPLFSDCLDGLMILDIQQLPASTIEALQQEK